MATKFEYPYSYTVQPWVQTNCPTVANNYGASTVYSQKYRETSGTKLPGFRQRLARGELLPFTPFEQYEYTYSAPGADNEYKVFNSPTCYEWFRNWIPPMAFSGHMTRDSMSAIADDYMSSANNELTEAAASLYADGWDALTFLAEWHKTVGMFRQTANRLRGFLDSYGPALHRLGLLGGFSFHPKQNNLEKLARGLGGDYLEARYGWRTLVYDTQDLSRMLARLDRMGLRRKKRKQEVVTVVQTTTQQMNSSGRWTSTWETTHTTVISARGTLVSDFRPPDFGFNPITTAWELIPLSFVVDWFVNVGQSLEAMSFVILSRGRYEAAVGIDIQRSYTSGIKSLAFVAPWYSSIFKRSASGTMAYTRRVPTRVSLTPSISVNLNAYKVADLVALLVGRWKSLLSQRR